MKDLENKNVKEIKIEDIEYKKSYTERAINKIKIWTKIIKEKNKIDPVKVMKNANGKYRVILGTERAIAAKRLGYKSIPCIVTKRVNDKKMVQEIRRRIEEFNKIQYHQEGDYLIPNLKVGNKEKLDLDYYGRARLDYLKNHRKGYYNKLLANGELTEDLKDKQNEANKIYENVFNNLSKNVIDDQKLKENDMLAWVGIINNYANIAREIAMEDVIYDD